MKRSKVVQKTNTQRLGFQSFPDVEAELNMHVTAHRLRERIGTDAAILVSRIAGELSEHFDISTLNALMLISSQATELAFYSGELDGRASDKADKRARDAKREDAKPRKRKAKR